MGAKAGNTNAKGPHKRHGGSKKGSHHKGHSVKKK